MLDLSLAKRPDGLPGSGTGAAIISSIVVESVYNDHPIVNLANDTFSLLDLSKFDLEYLPSCFGSSEGSDRWVTRAFSMS